MHHAPCSRRWTARLANKTYGRAAGTILGTVETLEVSQIQTCRLRLSRKLSTSEKTFNVHI